MLEVGNSNEAQAATAILSLPSCDVPCLFCELLSPGKYSCYPSTVLWLGVLPPLWDAQDWWLSSVPWQYGAKICFHAESDSFLLYLHSLPSWERGIILWQVCVLSSHMLVALVGLSWSDNIPANKILHPCKRCFILETGGMYLISSTKKEKSCLAIQMSLSEQA